jgi:mannose-6-phosphate isomerase-like protein (cupin superfamily)
MIEMGQEPKKRNMNRRAEVFRRRIKMLTTGNRLEEQGIPIPGTGFEYDDAGRLGELLARRTSFLYSDPNAGEWAFSIRSKDDTGAPVIRYVHVFRPKCQGPLEHVHPRYAEHFDVIQGTLLFTVDGEERDVSAGAELGVPRQTRHAFRNPQDTMAAMIIETRPEGAFGHTIQTFLGMSHEGRLGDGTRPPFWDAMALLTAFRDDLVSTAPPLKIARLLATVLAPVTRQLGHIADEPRYHDSAFWEARVEQPDA